MQTHLYVFGSGDCGQLGLGEDQDVAPSPSLHPYFEDKNITSVAAGGLHSLALGSDGRVYSWGCNDEKALGHSAPECQVAQVEGLPEHTISPVVQVAAGDSISAALTKDGRIYTWGTFRDSKGVLGHTHDRKADSLLQERPTMLQALQGENIIQIAAGSNHLLAVAADGQLFSWGCGEQGQLGRRVLERHKHLGLRPANVTPRMGRSHVKVTKVVAGSYHSLIVCEDGSLFSVGLNNFGQLALGDHSDRVTAEKVSLPPIIDAGAGEHHTILLGQDGQVYAAGRGDSGQLGITLTDGQRAVNSAQPLEGIESSMRIAAGGNHSMALGKLGVLYTWGYGEMHQLGHGRDEIEWKPRALKNSKFRGKVVQIAAGGQHSIVLSSE